MIDSQEEDEGEMEQGVQRDSQGPALPLEGGSCSVDLTNRPFAKLQTCMTKVHSIVLKEKLEANDM